MCFRAPARDAAINQDHECDSAQPKLLRSSDVARQAHYVQPTPVFFDVNVVSVFGFSLFRSCVFKSHDEPLHIGSPVVFGSTKLLPGDVCLLDGHS
jgi:hypothetical protein